MEDFKPVWQTTPSYYPICDPSLLSPLNQTFLRAAADTPSTVYGAAVARLQMRARKIAAFWSDYDLLLTPTLALPPVPVGWETEPADPWEQFDRAVQFTPFTAVFNVTGQPAISLPLHWSEAGLPIGVQLVADMGREDPCCGWRRSSKRRCRGRSGDRRRLRRPERLRRPGQLQP